MIVADFDVGGGKGGAAAAEQDALAGGFDEVVLDLEGTVLGVAVAARHRMRVDTRASECNAMEIAEVGIDDRYVGHTTQVDAVVSFILRRSMQPGAIDHNVIRRAFAREQTSAPRGSGWTSHFEADEAVIVGAGGEPERTVATRLNLYLRHQDRKS